MSIPVRQFKECILMAIVVVGATGMTGSRLVEQLTAAK